MLDERLPVGTWVLHYIDLGQLHNKGLPPLPQRMEHSETRKIPSVCCPGRCVQITVSACTAARHTHNSNPPSGAKLINVISQLLTKLGQPLLTSSAYYLDPNNVQLQKASFIFGVTVDLYIYCDNFLAGDDTGFEERAEKGACGLMVGLPIQSCLKAHCQHTEAHGLTLMLPRRTLTDMW